MSEIQKYEDFIDDLDGYIQDLGDEKINDLMETKKDVTHEGVECSRGKYNYIIHGNKNNEFFTVTFKFNLENYLENKDIDNPDEKLENVSEKNIQKLIYNLVESISTNDCGYNILTTDNNTFKGFSVSSRFYPYEDDFSLNELNRTIQNVISCGDRGIRFLQVALDVEDESDMETDTGMMFE